MPPSKTASASDLALVLALALSCGGGVGAQGLSVHALAGEVKVSRGGGPFLPLRRGDPVGPGDVVKTGAESRVSLAPPSGGAAPQLLTLGPKSQAATRTSGLGADLEYGFLHLASGKAKFLLHVGDTSCVAPGSDLVVTRVPRSGFHSVLVREGQAACGRGAAPFVVGAGQALGVKAGAQKVIALDEEAWNRAYHQVAFRDGPTGQTPGTRGLERVKPRGDMRRGVFRRPDTSQAKRFAVVDPKMYLGLGGSLSGGWHPENCEGVCRDLPWCRAWSFGAYRPGLGAGQGDCVVMDHVSAPQDRRIATEATGVLRPVSHEYPKLLATETVLRDPVVRRGVGAAAGKGFLYDLDSREVKLSTRYAKTGTRGNPSECEDACRENPHCQLWTFQQTRQNAKGHWRGAWCRIYFQDVPTAPLAHGVTGWVRAQPR